MAQEINKERLEILNKINQLEQEEFFDTDVENDPPAKTLMPEEIDYLRKKLKNKFLSHVVNKKADKGIKGLIEARQLIIKEVKGAENIKKVKGSALVTSNHFHIFENMAIYEVFKKYGNKKNKFWRVIREGNFTAPPKGFDMFFKHANTLPLSSNMHTMQKFFKAIETLTKQKNNYILMYPEQYMWWNYKKPRPFKDGVFKFAFKFNTPIIPCFITMEDSDVFDADGLPVQAYTVHIMPPIYPNIEQPAKENIQQMKELNFNLCKEVYEKVYNEKLTYSKAKK